jgi:hypothetical protein
VRAHRELQAALGKEFPLITMFEHTTVQRLAAALAEPERETERGVHEGFERDRRRRTAREGRS